MTRIERLKAWLRERAWARVVAGLLIVVTLPIWIIWVILFVIVAGPYTSVTAWVNDRDIP